MEALLSLDFSTAVEYLPALLDGLWTNILLTFLGFVCGGLVLGTLLAFANLSRFRAVRWPAMVFVEIWRSTPLLVQAIWMHFAFPIVTGIATSPFQSALLALVFNVSAYCSEIIRSGILGVPQGQFEAARALGLKPVVLWWFVVMPQALRLVLPPLVGTTISVFKATAILSILSINDLMRAAARISSYTYQPIEIYTMAAFLAFAVGGAITYGGYRLERRLKRGWA